MNLVDFQHQICPLIALIIATTPKKKPKTHPTIIPAPKIAILSNIPIFSSSKCVQMPVDLVYLLLMLFHMPWPATGLYYLPALQASPSTGSWYPFIPFGHFCLMSLFCSLAICILMYFCAIGFINWQKDAPLCLHFLQCAGTLGV